MTDKEKEIYNAIKQNINNETNCLLYCSALKLPVLKKYTYENRKKILNGMVKRGLIKFIIRNGYITNIELLEGNLK